MLYCKGVALVCLTIPAFAQDVGPVEKTVAFRGIVTDLSTRLPLEGASVQLRMAIAASGANMNVIGGQARSFTTTSNAKGEFSLDLPVAPYSITATREGYGVDVSTERVAQVDDKPREPLSIKMVRSSKVSGITENEDGKPVAGISVELIEPVTEQTLRAVSAADGTFQLGPVVMGNTHYAVA